MAQSDDLEVIRAQLRASASNAQAQYHRDLERRLEPARHGLAEPMSHPVVGAGPFEPAQVIAAGAVDTGSIGPRAWFRGPDDMDIDVTYLSPGIVATVQRHDGVDLVADTTVNWATPGVFLASVVILRDGETVTLIPTYTGTDITHIDRVVT